VFKLILAKLALCENSVRAKMGLDKSCIPAPITMGEFLLVLFASHLHLQDTSKLPCVEDFFGGMLGKLKFE
jgi:hypothetical protein